MSLLLAFIMPIQLNHASLIFDSVVSNFSEEIKET